MSAMHVALVNEYGFSPADFVAGAMGPLDLESDFDVIRYLKEETPEQYRAVVITSHMDAARYLARETIAAAAEGLR